MNFVVSCLKNLNNTNSLTLGLTHPVKLWSPHSGPVWFHFLPTKRNVLSVIPH